MASGVSSQRRVDPSMPVKRNVTVPDGPSMCSSIPRQVCRPLGKGPIRVLT